MDTKDGILPTTGHRPRPLDAIRTGTMSINAALLTALRADLLSGRIAPNEKLKIPKLVEHYSVTPGAVREVLSRLVSDGLVSFADQRGFRAASITLDQLRDVTRVRIMIEREALVDAIRNGDEEWETAILSAHHRLSRRSRLPGDAESAESVEWMHAHRDFHLALVSACRSEWLLRFRNILYDQSERYRLVSTQAQFPPRNEGCGDEHGDLAKLVIGRDEVGALALIEHHIETTATRVVSALSSIEAASNADRFSEPASPCPSTVIR